jgi:hypothetical protein
VLGDGNLRPVVIRGFEDYHVWNVVWDPRRHAHRAGIEMRAVFVREVGDELDSLVRVDPGVGPRVIHVLAAVLGGRAHAHQRRTAHTKVHLGTG